MPSVLHRYGGKKKLLFWIFDAIRWRLGYYKNSRAIGWEEVERIIFVCKGNICRSAYAHAYATNTKLSEYVKIDSFGVETTPGKAANNRAICIAKKRGLSLASHSTKQPDALTLTKGDLILHMEPAHKYQLAQLIGKVPGQESYLALWANQPAYIPDPYGAENSAFERCFSLIENSIDAVSERIELAKCLNHM
ncbi:arsenate-mycothiol transferase ArsC [Porticoccus sp. GXU_MW_L64]